MEEAKPRVNGALIAKFVGKRVTIVGRYMSVRKMYFVLLKVLISYAKFVNISVTVWCAVRLESVIM